LSLDGEFLMDTWAAQFALGMGAILALVFANGFFVAAEFSLVTVRKTRIDQLIAEGHPRARTVRRALSDPDSYIAATQLGITMASIGLGWIGEPALASLFEPLFASLPAAVSAAAAHSVAAALAFAVITALHIVLGELAPKSVALQQAERTALWVAWPTEVFMRLFWPFIRLLNGMGRAVVQAIGLKPPSGHALVHSEEELKMLVTASQEAGVLEEQEEQMLHRVFGFGDLTAAEVMIPRTELVTVPLDATLDVTLGRVAAAGRCRVPVHRASEDDVIGMLHLTDLVRALATPTTEPFAVEPLVREVLTVPETRRCDELLAQMQERGVLDALVIDEYGATAGLVTFEQLLERIAGEPAPEAGRLPRVVALADGSCLLDGLMLVRDVNERFGLHLDEETYRTIGGYVLGRLGRRARVGDTVEIEGRLLRVEALDGLRVARVFLSRPLA
jgi:CBS domain containing-hemolysin-like protein